jgi:hypothetical protein
VLARNGCGQSASASGPWSFSIAQPPGSLVVTVQDQSGAPRSGAKVVRYSHGSAAALDTVTTSESGQTPAYINLPPGSTYDFEAYYEGVNPFDNLGELWATATATVVAGANNLLMRRNWPYAESFRIFRDDNNWELTGTKSIAPRQTLRLEVGVRNGTTSDKNVSTFIVLDANQSQPWEYSAPSVFYTVPAQSNSYISHPLSLVTPGVYQKAIRTEESSGGKTDAWNWVPAFQILPLPEEASPRGSIDFPPVEIAWEKIDWSKPNSAGVDSNNVREQNGELILSVKDGSGVGAEVESVAQYGFGRYEARFKAGAETSEPYGVTAGFFHYWHDSMNIQEIDVEINSKEVNQVNFVIHHPDRKWHFICPVSSPGLQYHTYSFDWLPTSVTFFIDDEIASGCEQREEEVAVGVVAIAGTAGIPDKPGTLILNNWTGEPQWSGYPPKDSGDHELHVNSVTYVPYISAASPSSPSPLDPSNDAAVTISSPIFEWTEFSGGQGGGSQAGYHLRVYSVSSGGSVIYNTGFIEDSLGRSHVYSPGSFVGPDPVSGVLRISQELQPGERYSWIVRYRDSAGNWSSWSSPQDFITEGSGSGSVPSPDPSWLRVTALSQVQLNLLWVDNSSNEDGFKVERKEGCCGPWTEIATLPANSTTYQSAGLTCNTTYAYRVWAYNTTGSSGKTNEANSTTSACPPDTIPTPAPSWLRAAAASPTQINLQWDDNSPNETGFKVERKEGCCGPWVEIATLAANSTTYQSSGLKCSTTYAYRVWAFNAVGDSNKTNEAATTTPGC